ncbi:MAG TPA: recombinase family protein [Panacibacter sp.]|nr:recombinase family protein [Panacibacter sp.]HNP46065.1 recombinase family protein [Panacibacter sp.]
MKQNLRYFIYARKSSEGADRQILSIDGQLKELRRVAQRDNLTIVGQFTESKSAHLPNNRPAFNDMMKRIQQSQANGILVWHINRISRNPKESGMVQQLLQDGIILSIITPYRNFRTEDNALLFSIETSEANQYSRDLSVNVKRGLRQKYEMGHPPGYAQLGYLNTKSNVRGANKIIVDPDRWHIVRKGFELMLSGVHSVSEILSILNNEFGLRTRPSNFQGGRPLSKSGLYRILTNPFYYGYFYRNGILYKGAYPPMITPEEFDHIQILLGRDGKPRNQKHEFPYTGFIKCGDCGSAITASKKHKFIKSTGTIKSYVFYHCTHRKKGASSCTERSWHREQCIEQQIVAELTRYQIKEEYKRWTLDLLKENYQDEIDKIRQVIISQEQFEKKLLLEIDNLVDLRISNGISEETFLKKKAEKEEQLVRVQSIGKNIQRSSADWISEIENQFDLIVDIVPRFNSGDPKTKKQICHNFGSNWVLKDKKLFIIKHEWLEPLKKFKDGVDDIKQRFEPENNKENKGFNSFFDMLRPLVRGFIDEVRTKNNSSGISNDKSHPLDISSYPHL